MFLMTPMDGLDRCETVAEERMIAELGLRTLPEWLGAVYDHIEEWRLPIVEPRKLVPPGGYHSPKGIAAGLDSILRTNEMKTDAERISDRNHGAGHSVTRR
jgi:hypothetical protein